MSSLAPIWNGFPGNTTWRSVSDTTQAPSTMADGAELLLPAKQGWFRLFQPLLPRRLHAIVSGLTSHTAPGLRSGTSIVSGLTSHTAPGAEEWDVHQRWVVNHKHYSKDKAVNNLFHKTFKSWPTLLIIKSQISSPPPPPRLLDLIIPQMSHEQSRRGRTKSLPSEAIWPIRHDRQWLRNCC
jgi:hypothetical protein